MCIRDSYECAGDLDEQGNEIDNPNTVCDTPGEAVGLNSAQRDSIRDSFDSIETYANIEFVEVAFTPDAANAAIVLGTAFLTSSNTAGLPESDFVPGSGALVFEAQGAVLGDIFFDRGAFNPSFNFDAGAGSDFRIEALDAIAETLGLDDPGVDLPNASDFDYNTVRSGNTGGPFDPLANFSEPAGAPATFQLYDVQEIQNLYGVNTTFNDGDNSYGNFFSGGDLHFIDNDNAIQTTLFDAGGVDTYNFTNHIADETIDLRQGTFTSINGNAVSYTHLTLPTIYSV